MLIILFLLLAKFKYLPRLQKALENDQSHTGMQILETDHSILKALKDLHIFKK